MEHAPCLELVVYDQVRPEFATITKIVAGFTIFKMGLDLTDLAKFSRSGLSMLPIEICLGGRKMLAVQSIMDALTRGGENIGSVDTPFGTLKIDAAHAPERVLAYCFYNILEHYRNSPLGQRIAAMDWIGKTFVDVGANLGIYSLIARSKGAAVFMVEPEPAHAHFLRRNEKILGTSYSIALSDVAGQLPLYYSPTNSGATSLIQSAGYIRSEDTVAISTFSHEYFGDPAKIALVKIDVEGSENQTVGGMKDFLEAGHRPDIWCEVRGGTASRSRNSYIEVIQSLGRCGYNYSLGSPGEAAFEDRSVFDLLFFARVGDSSNF